MELFRHHRLDRISAQVRRWRIEQCGIVDLNRTWSDRIPKTHIDLDGNTSGGDRGTGADAYTAVLEVFADRCGLDPIDIKRYAIVGDSLPANLTERLAGGLGTVVP